MPYDLFISYSRRDDQNGRLTELKDRISADYRAFAGEELRCFFDREDIRTMDDWRHRILAGLRESSLLLLILSPSYLTSPYCEWEIVEYLKYEHSRAVGGQGVAPIYFVEVPGIETVDFERQATEWVRRVSRRNRVDLRPWYDEGANCLNTESVRTRLEDLERSLHERLSKLRRIEQSSGNLPAYNPYFVGREEEMRLLHESAGLGKFGVLTAVQGLGGFGKTALAIQYAYAYADFFPGGRWMVGCAGTPNLAAALRTLDLDLGVTFTEEEKRDEIRGARRILAELEQRARAGAQTRSGEPNPPEPRALLLLDNVDQPALLQPPQSDVLSGKRWLHVVATTRLGAAELGYDESRQTLLNVDRLPPEDAVRLLERLQPGQKFASDAEREAAGALADLLGGFTLAVEVAGVYLGELRGQVTCAAFVERLRREGLAGLDAAAGKTRRAVSHSEKLVGATLGPTLDLLNPTERLVLDHAAFLPPDQIPLPWLRTVAIETDAELGADPGPGYPDPWTSLINRLLDLRLLQVAESDPSTGLPRIVRMHRLISELVRQRTGDKRGDYEDRLRQLAQARADEARENWHRPEAQWEIEPLVAVARAPLFVGLSTEETSAALFLNDVGVLSFQLARYSDARPLFERALAIQEKVVGREHSDTAQSLNNLASLLKAQGNLAAARPLFERALAIREKVLGREHSDTAQSLNNLALLLQNQGDLAAARPLYERALAIWEKALGLEHPDTATSLNNLALLLKAQGNLAAARPLFERALAINEKVLGPEHPYTATSLNSLASLLHGQGDLAAARPLYERALAIQEKVLGPEHPDTAISLNNLAVLLQVQGDLVAARPFFERALAIQEKVLGPEHPDTATSLNNLALLLKDKGNLDAARPLYERALAIQEKVLGSEHPDTATSLNNLASLLQAQGDLAAARPLFERALAISEKVLGPEHPDTATSLNNLASLLHAQGDLAAARPLFESALAIREKVLGPEHPATATSLNNLAVLLQDQGDFAAARPLYERALSIREKVLGPEHPDTANSLSSLASLLQAQGDFAAARPLFESALAIREKVLGPEHPATATSLSSLASLLQAQGDFAAARPLYERALAIQEKVLGSEHPDTATSLSNLADLLEKIGEGEDARSLRQRLLAGVAGKKDLPPLSVRQLALDAYTLGDYVLAGALLRRVLEAKFEVPGTRCHLARLALLTDDREEARSQTDQAWASRAEAEPYVLGRILWLQAAAAMLDGRGDDAIAVLGRLKTALQLPGKRVEWAMTPVLEHLRPKLREEQHALLAALVEAMGSRDKEQALDQFASWREAPALSVRATSP